MWEMQALEGEERWGELLVRAAEGRCLTPQCPLHTAANVRGHRLPHGKGQSICCTNYGHRCSVPMPSPRPVLTGRAPPPPVHTALKACTPAGCLSRTL